MKSTIVEGKKKVERFSWFSSEGAYTYIYLSSQDGGEEFTAPQS